MKESLSWQGEGALQNKVCLITGASRTLGAVIAKRMAHYGVKVVVNCNRSQEAAQALCQELTETGMTALPIQADVSQADDVARLVSQTRQQFGPIDILVNNVGPYVDAPFLDLSLSDFDRIMAGKC